MSGDPFNPASYRAVQAQAISSLSNPNSTTSVVLNTWRNLLSAYFPPSRRFWIGPLPPNFPGAATRGDSLIVTHPPSGEAQIVMLFALGAVECEYGRRIDLMTAASTRLQQYMRMHTNRTAAIYGILAIGSRAWVYVRDPYSGQIMPLRPTADPEYDSDNERTGVPGGIGSGDPNCFDMLTKHGASRMEDTIFEMMVEWKGLLGFS